QAEDGIRDRNVTGVQTCALPISGMQDAGCWGGRAQPAAPQPPNEHKQVGVLAPSPTLVPQSIHPQTSARLDCTKSPFQFPYGHQIGRASCRERAYNRVGAVTSEK